MPKNAANILPAPNTLPSLALFEEFKAALKKVDGGDDFVQSLPEWSPSLNLPGCAFKDVEK